MEGCQKCKCIIPYSQKYWQELNLVVGSQIAIPNVLADLNLVVRYRIAICIYTSKKFWRILIWWLLRQSAKLPNFPAIWYCLDWHLSSAVYAALGGLATQLYTYSAQELK